MTDTSHENHHTEKVQEHLKQVEALLHKHALVEEVAHKQELPRKDRHALVDTLLHKQHLTELQRKLESLHPADIAYILEALPIEQRLLVWDLVKSERDGEILIEVSDSVRESLIATMNREELRAAAFVLNPGLKSYSLKAAQAGRRGIGPGGGGGRGAGHGHVAPGAGDEVPPLPVQSPADVDLHRPQAGSAGVGRGSARLATYPYRRALYRGVGVDGLQIFDDAAQTTKSVGNVMLIPADALTESGRAMCPSR